MTKCNELKERIQVYLPHHGARLNFMARFVMSVIVVRSVTLRRVASVLNPSVLIDSNEKRIKRFFRQVTIAPEGFARLMLALLPIKTKLVLTLDRTTWQLGSCSINILMLGVAYKGIAFPLLWTLLDKQGNSTTNERLALIDKLLTVLSAQDIDSIVADREFTGCAWFKGLAARDVTFVMRIRNNSLIGSRGRTLSAHVRYAHLRPKEVYVCPKRCWLFGLRVYLSATRTPEGELLVLACNCDPAKALLRYAQRWQVETLFSALKSRGFNLEDSHMLHKQRFDTLLALLSLAFAWAHLVGEWCYQHFPLKLKKHGYLPMSYFRRGLDTLRAAILAGSTPAKISLDTCLKLLSP